MKEVSDIIKAYGQAKKLGKKTALATVVKVEGSSYRQPGARMLVTEDGMLTGAISGGCLEGDALKKALLSIYQNQNKLVTYDTSNEDDADFGVQLGCNGIVHILFEPIDDTKENNPIQLLEQLSLERKNAIVVTLFSLNRNTDQPGTVLFYRDFTVSSASEELKNQLLPDVNSALEIQKSAIKTYDHNGQELHGLIEFIPPPLALIIAGAGNDIKPLVEMASLLGWEITIADGRNSHATMQRFPKADSVLIAKPSKLIEKITIDSQTFLLLMTHNYKYDLALLKLVLEHDFKYIGVLGPKSKLQRMFDDLNAENIVLTEQQMDCIYGPVGLDLGAETAEEIALSIVAEIKAVATGKTGNFLKWKEDKIHTNTLLA